MTLTSVATLTIFFVLILEASGQMRGILGGVCTDNQRCLDNGSHVCDNSTGSPLCKIKAGKFCGRQKAECVSGASCQDDSCLCASGQLNSGLCMKPITSTSKAQTTTTTSTTTTTTTTATTTTIAATTEEAEDKATKSSQSARKPSGAVTWTGRGLSHVIQLLAAILLCLISP